MEQSQGYGGEKNDAEEIVTDEHLETEAANRGPQMLKPSTDKPLYGVNSIRLEDIDVNAIAEQSEKELSFPELHLEDDQRGGIANPEIANADGQPNMVIRYNSISSISIGDQTGRSNPDL